jgi:putative protease
MIFGLFKKKNKSSQAKTKPKKTSKKEVKKAVKSKVPKQELVGDIVHYFPKVKAAVIKIKKGPLSVGDVIYIKGHTTDLMQKIASMQIDHVDVKKATKGKEVGVRVKKRVRITDKVYRDKK